MNPRLIILIVVAAGLAVFFAIRLSSPPKPEAQTVVNDGLSPAERERLKVIQTPLRNRPLAGKEPDVPPELAIRVEVDPTGKKNRLDYYITEKHGYYVESFEIEFYYKPKPDTTPDDSPLAMIHRVENEYLKANDTLASCFFVVPAELEDVGGEIGASKNWGARILSHGRARMQNPDPLPLVDKVKCD